jgi:chromosome segregation ATPase
VKKFLIISQAIEQTLLIPERRKAMSIMYDGPRPKNVRQAFCHQEGKRGFSFRLAWGRSAESRDMSPVPPSKYKPKMKTDIESRISYQRETVTHLEREKANLENSRRRIQADLKKCEQAVIQHKRDTQAFKLAMQRADDKVEALRAELDSFEVEDGRVDGLREELEEAQNEVAICEESYGNLGLEKLELNKNALKKKQELTATVDRLQEFDVQLTKAKDKVRNREQARRHILTEKNNAFDEIVPLNAAKAKAEEKRDREAITVKDWTRQAEQVCARVPLEPGDTLERLDARLTAIEKSMKEYQRAQGGTDEEINHAAVKSKEIWQTAVAHRREMDELLALLKKSFMTRLNMYRAFQRHISARSRINFNYLLSERAFRGKLTIDHKAKALDVHVEPDETTKSSKGRQTKTLSGGEKSFSSICLLLSLWEAMGAPLRCLDEFDVFMDDVNRDVSTRMIVSFFCLCKDVSTNNQQISAARRSVGRQFILITPKALGAGAADAEDVKIIKLVK